MNCIQVDDADAANSKSGSYSKWVKNSFAYYSENCNYTLNVNDKIISNSIRIFPNPSDETVFIDTKILLKKIEIFSSSGNKLDEFNSNLKSLSLKNYKTGMYIIRIHSDKGVTSIKLIKK